MQKLINLRHTLHQHPEISGQEFQTAQRICNFIEQHHPTKVLTNLGGTGVAAIYQFGKTGATVAIRCELDALPIVEVNSMSYRSMQAGVSHKCGHDGHMAIVAGLIFWLKQQSFSAGKVILLFQSAEETGKGAYQMLQDARFADLKIDYLFALHNIPGVPMYQILTMEKGFSAEVQSFSIHLTGKESHAAEPEKGINPAVGIAQLITAFAELNHNDPTCDNFRVLTPVYVNMGQQSYGISPAKGELHYTIRTWQSEQMEDLVAQIKTITKRVCQAQQLQFSINWFEHFPANANDTVCNQLITKAAQENNFTLIKRPYPFKFGEDFGWFSKQYQTAMFGLGAGENTPALHAADYDFPDELIETGVKMFANIISQLLGTKMK
ncbi:MAG: amidohydrolase [Saprospiraceae bacterium]